MFLSYVIRRIVYNKKQNTIHLDMSTKKKTILTKYEQNHLP